MLRIPDIGSLKGNVLASRQTLLWWWGLNCPIAHPHVIWIYKLHTCWCCTVTNIEVGPSSILAMHHCRLYSTRWPSGRFDGLFICRLEAQRIHNRLALTLFDKVVTYLAGSIRSKWTWSCVRVQRWRNATSVVPCSIERNSLCPIRMYRSALSVHERCCLCIICANVSVCLCASARRARSDRPTCLAAGYYRLTVAWRRSPAAASGFEGALLLKPFL